MRLALESIYLDTARLGPICHQAQQAHNAFVHTFASVPMDPALGRFLLTGDRQEDVDISIRGTPLVDWQGIDGFASSLARFIGVGEDCPVYFANRTITLARIGMQMISKVCRKCLTIDQCWPKYLGEVQQSCAQGASSLFVKRSKRPIFCENISEEEYCEQLCDLYDQEGCDGLFLPIVDHLGARIPVAKIVQTLVSWGCEIRWIALDASQAFGHVSFEEEAKLADWIFAGTHKWLRSYFPLGIAWAPNGPHHRGVFEAIIESIDRPGVDDGLLAMTISLRHRLALRTETTNLAPLFAGFGALREAKKPTPGTMAMQQSNRDRMAIAAESVGWETLSPQSSFRSGILLLHRAAESLEIDPVLLHESLCREKIFATVYESGLMRLTLPSETFCESYVQRIQRSLANLVPSRLPS